MQALSKHGMQLNASTVMPEYTKLVEQIQILDRFSVHFWVSFFCLNNLDSDHKINRTLLLIRRYRKSWSFRSSRWHRAVVSQNVELTAPESFFPPFIFHSIFLSFWKRSLRFTGRALDKWQADQRAFPERILAAFAGNLPISSNHRAI
jgi:hypothetical protein